MKRSLLSSVLISSIAWFSLQAAERSSEPVLKEKQGWNIDSITSGIIRYHYSGYYVPIQAFQNINILEIDLSREENHMKFVYIDQGDSLSAVGERYRAFAGINGSYEPEASYIKVDGCFQAKNKLDKKHQRYWKHEGGLFYDPQKKAVEIRFTTDQEYEKHESPNILSGAPMLIDDYNPVGLYFIGEISHQQFKSLAYEDYRRHQGVRHPRTAVALTCHQKLLLITVDGRERRAQGMSARELTQFLRRYFDPQSALNIDGGGSTTMWIRKPENEGSPVINYPTDNKRFDHNGQRKITSFILITRSADK